MQRRMVIIAAVVAPVVTAAVLVSLRDLIDRTNLALILVIVIVVIASTGDRVAGVVAAVSAVLSFDFFLTQPYFSMAISARRDIETAVILLIVGAVVSEVAARGRRASALADDRAVDLSRVGHLAQTANAPHHLTAVGDALALELRELLPTAACRYERVPRGRALPALELDGTVNWNGRRYDISSDGFPREIIEISAGAEGGRFVFVPRVGERVDRQKLLLSATLVQQFASMARTPLPSA